nr:hypothetical protein [Sphingomonas sp.]
MPYYRLYFLDGFTGHIDHFREFEAEDDEAAVRVAERWREDRAMDLWNRERKLKRWERPALPD